MEQTSTTVAVAEYPYQYNQYCFWTKQGTKSTCAAISYTGSSYCICACASASGRRLLHSDDGSVAATADAAAVGDVTIAADDRAAVSAVSAGVSSRQAEVMAAATGRLQGIVAAAAGINAGTLGARVVPSEAQWANAGAEAAASELQVPVAEAAVTSELHVSRRAAIATLNDAASVAAFATGLQVRYRGGSLPGSQHTYIHTYIH